MKYIEQNPLRAGMVKNIEDYRWSSYLLNVRKKKSVLIDRDENLVFQGLGSDDHERIKAYRKLVDISLNGDELEAIHMSTRKGGNYLSEKFQRQMNLLLPNKRRRGRPRKTELILSD
jgi:hypothetical protein